MGVGGKLSAIYLRASKRAFTLVIHTFEEERFMLMHAEKCLKCHGHGDCARVSASARFLEALTLMFLRVSASALMFLVPRTIVQVSSRAL